MTRGSDGSSNQSRIGLPGALITGIGLAFVLLAAPLCTAWAGGIEGLSYSLHPGVEYMRWGENIRLDDDVVYGGRLGINFGRYVSLRGFYFGNSNIGITAGDQPAVPGVDLGHTDLANYGGDLALYFPYGSVFPFISGGGGIYRFDPSGGDRVKKIGLRFGGGLRFAVTPRVQATLYAEDAMLKGGAELFAGEDGEDSSSNNDMQHSLALGASLNFFLGGYQGETVTDREYLNKFSGGITGASWRIEPFAGKLNFESGVKLDDTELLGARMGLGLGPYVDLRGYYWRGMNNDFDEAERIQSYGAEAMFNLNPSPGVEPHILLGVGSLDFMSGYKDPNGLTVEDKSMLIAGIGIDLTLSDRWRISIDARDYIFGSSDLQNTESLDELYHNWMYSAGLSFTLGGRGKGREAGVPLMAPAAAPAAPAAAPAAPEAAPAAAPAVPAVAPAVVPTGKAVVETLVVEKEVTPPEWMASPVRTYQGDRVVTLPVPTVGEIYVRYGEPGAVSIESKSVAEEKAGQPGAAVAPQAAPGVSTTEQEMMRSAVREVLQQEMAKARADWMRAAADSLSKNYEALGALEKRLMKRMDERIEERVQEEVAQRGAPAVTVPPTTVTVPAPVTVVTEESAGRGLIFDGGQVYTGANVDKPRQWILGGRLRLRREGGTWPIYYEPELAFGFFNHTSTLIAANVVWDLGDHIDVQGYRPYVSVGLGLLFFSKKTAGRDKNEGVLNLGYGVSKDFGNWFGFVEHQGIDLYSLHRVRVGIGWKR
jgi:hypothetical protein